MHHEDIVNHTLSLVTLFLYAYREKAEILKNTDFRGISNIQEICNSLIQSVLVAVLIAFGILKYIF